ncbi:MAG: ABC transporter ATP-binding protein [Pseudomonadota bacterium]
MLRGIFGDRGFIWVTLVYGIVVSLLTLALPISVQVLIGAVANTAVVRSVVVLAIVLFTLLALSGLLVAMQTYVLELFQRRFYGRMSAEIALRTIYSRTDRIEQINREGLMNHYFEIDVILKALPSLLSNGLALGLQTLVGYLVVSFYHPVFLFFCVVHALMVYLIWRHADRGAVESVIQLSSAKHEMARWLEALARNHRHFKSEAGISFAVRRTDELADKYIARHKRHFGYFFSQHVGMLALYAIGSAVVLGVAGWLVIQGQLSLGQLVAAELILGAIFVGLSRASYYLELYYSIRGSLDKLSRVYHLPLEIVSGDQKIEEWHGDVVISGAAVNVRGCTYHIDAEFPAGSQTLVAAENSGIVMATLDILWGARRPDSGGATLGGHDVRDFDPHRLRNEVKVVADSNLFECTVVDYLHIGDPDLSRAKMRELLNVVGLSSVIEQLPGGLDCLLNDGGMPLSNSEVLRLKIAQAIASRPRVLILSPACDVLRLHRRQRILDYLNENSDLILIVFSNRRDLDHVSRYMNLCDSRSQVFLSLEELLAEEARAAALRESGPPKAVPPADPIVKESA